MHRASHWGMDGRAARTSGAPLAEKKARGAFMPRAPFHAGILTTVSLNRTGCRGMQHRHDRVTQSCSRPQQDRLGRFNLGRRTLLLEQWLEMIDPTRAATAKIASAGRPFTRGGRKLEKRAGFGRRERKQLDLGLKSVRPPSPGARTGPSFQRICRDAGNSAGKKLAPVEGNYGQDHIETRRSVTALAIAGASSFLCRRRNYTAYSRSGGSGNAPKPGDSTYEIGGGCR
jgi:hypothetical protein